MVAQGKSERTALRSKVAKGSGWELVNRRFLAIRVVSLVMPGAMVDCNSILQTSHKRMHRLSLENIELASAILSTIAWRTFSPKAIMHVLSPRLNADHARTCRTPRFPARTDATVSTELSVGDWGQGGERFVVVVAVGVFVHHVYGKKCSFWRCH